MKSQIAKFKVGQIVTKDTNNFKRLIVNLYHKERSGILKVIYFYQNELLNDRYEPTGYFDERNMGMCSQDRMVSWLKGTRN